MEATSSTTRSQFLAQVGAAVVASTAFPGIASAAKYGSFGAGSPGVLNPSEAIIDEDAFKSGEVQRALSDIKEYSALVGEMKKALAGNSQVNLGPAIRKQFDFAKLRASLNTFNTAFDEETQRGTDRLIRGVLQDLTELETANTQKEGIERSERRVGIMNAKLDKLQCAFDDFLAFSK